jgi:hypothetical protein
MKVVRLTPLLAALVVMACLPAVTQANLVIQGTVEDNVNDFHAVLQWTSAAPDPSFLILGGVNWEFRVLASVGGALVSTVGQRLVPSPGLMLMTLNNPIVPGGASSAKTSKERETWATGIDELRVSITAQNNTSLIHIDAMHSVPEPTNAATWIFAGGSLLFAARRRFYRR